jgi:tripartite-type tricarboxylate transporter receptor subunit TctC
MKCAVLPKLRLTISALIGALSLSAIGLTQAQSYPVKPIRVIVPYAAGGFSDQSARVLAEALGQELKQPLVIENRAGGGGRIGVDAVTKLPADGYHLLITTNGTHTYMAVTEKSLSYDPIQDFTPISQVGTYGLLMVVHPSLPVNNVREFIDHAKKNPGALNYASSGMGSGLHFAGEVFKSMANVDMAHIAYKGSGPGISDVLAGTCQLIFAGEAKPYIDAGRLRLLGTTSATRDPRFPNAPTIAEGGLPGYDLTYWVGLFAPKGLAPELQTRLNAAVKKVLNEPAVRQRFVELGLVPVGSSPDQLVTAIREETQKLRSIAAAIPGGIN